MLFKDVKIGQMFQIEGEDGQRITLVKVENEWREPYCPTNAENAQLGGVFVDDKEPVIRYYRRTASDANNDWRICSECGAEYDALKSVHDCDSRNVEWVGSEEGK